MFLKLIMHLKRTVLLYLMILIVFSLIYFSNVPKKNMYKGAFNNASRNVTLSIVVRRGNQMFIPPLPDCDHILLQVLIVVCSATENFEARQAIRSTWGNTTNLGPDIDLRFLIGRPKDRFNERYIYKEKKRHFDIIHYDFLDTYLNLTLKTFILLDWFSHRCKNAKYVMKVDDDTFVNIDNLRVKLQQLKSHEMVLLGHLIKDAKPDKDVTAKFYMPDYMYNEATYPNYLSGSAYVMSKDVIAELYQKALNKPFFYFEDIFFTGICTRDSDMVLIHSDKFLYLKPFPHFCVVKDLITAHKLSPKLLHFIWDLSHTPVKCNPISTFFMNLM